MAGRLVSAVNSDARVTFERDALGRVIGETVDGRRVSSTFDCCGNRTARLIGERLVAATYDPLGALQSLVIGDHAPLHLFHDKAGREERRHSPLGFTLDLRHDVVGQLLTQAAGAQQGGPKGEAGIPTIQRVYNWNGAFEPTGILDARWGETAYAYDGNGQVAEGRHGDGLAERFDYDRAMNVAGSAEAAPSDPLGVELASFGGTRMGAWRLSPGGRVIEARGPMGERVVYTNDARGQVVERRIERAGFRPVAWRYTWDGRGRLVGCETPQGERWAYGYDPFGRRLWKRRVARQRPERGPDGRDRLTPPVGTHYGWDGDLLSEEAPLAADGTPDWDRAVCWHYDPGTFRPLAREGADGRLLYVVTDHLGTPREMLDETGTLVWAAEYRVWGAMRRWWVAANDDEPGGRLAYTAGNLALALAPSAHAEERFAAAFCPIRFQGQWADQETGLSYNRFRYYDAATCQYASPDPIGIVGGLRNQAYVENPTVGRDPLGLACCVGKYTYTDTAGKHMDDLGKDGTPARPYMQSEQTIDQIRGTGPGEPDPQGALPNARYYNVPGTMNGSVGNYQLLVDPNTNTIYHFQFKSGR